MNVSIVGTGYVGLVTGICLASVGHRVVCVDVDADRVASVNAGKAPFLEPGLDEMLQTGLSEGVFSCVLADDWDDIGDVVFIAVATPSGAEGQDLRFVEAAAKAVAERFRQGRYYVVVVKSTVAPGTTRQVVLQVLDQAADVDTTFGVCTNPEFLREGSAVADFMDPDRIVIGSSEPRAAEIVAELYRSFDCPTIRTNLENAEMIKYASNALLSTMISFSNEIAGICESIPGADIREVMSGVHADRRLSVYADGKNHRPGILSYLWAGCGFGGSCLPKDVNALRHHARANDIPADILDGVISTNDQRAERICSLTSNWVGGLDGKVCSLLGLAFKAGTDDLRDSPALKIAKMLGDAGATVRGFDPAIAHSTVVPGVVVCSSANDCVDGADCVLICTAWEEFRELDWESISARMRQPTIVDGRDLLDPGRLPSVCTYVRLGYGYTTGEGV